MVKGYFQIQVFPFPSTGSLSKGELGIANWLGFYERHPLPLPPALLRTS
jgi:hypothetical protein